jgi:shikimate kinase
MMGAGKTTVGREVAARLGWPYVDNDELVGLMAGMDSPTLAATRGVDALHEVELRVLDDILARPGPLVAGAPAFVVDDARSVERLHSCAVVVWLRARPETLLERIGDGAGRRDDATSAAWLAEVATRRAPAYANLADVIVDVDDRRVEEIADEITSQIAARGPKEEPR